MYHDRRMVLPWIGGPEGTQTSDHWGVHPRPDHRKFNLNKKI